MSENDNLDVLPPLFDRPIQGEIIGGALYYPTNYGLQNFDNHKDRKTMQGLDNYKLNSNEDALLSAEEMDAQMEADEAAALEGLRETAEDFCDYVNGKSYFGGWYAEVVEGKVLIVNDVSDQATHEFDAKDGGYTVSRGARSTNWFSDALTGYIVDWNVRRASMEAKKAAMKGGAK